MKKKIFFTGSVFEFFIPEIGKYSYCKYFDFTHVSAFHGLLAQVFDYFSDEEELNILEKLAISDWLFGPRSIHKWPDLRKGTGWKYLGILHSEKDEIMPDFKSVQAVVNKKHKESEIGPWYPVHGLILRGDNCSYEDVRHLENKVLTTTYALTIRTGMEYCRKNNLNIEEYYDLSDEGVNNVYYYMMNTPQYNSIPIQFRGKAKK